MSELDGRGRRVAGFFVFMLGAGLVLESPALWYGVAIMAVGATCFGWGMLSRRNRPGDAS
jgi:hypothetical protein